MLRIGAPSRIMGATSPLAGLGRRSPMAMPARDKHARGVGRPAPMAATAGTLGRARQAHGQMTSGGVDVPELLRKALLTGVTFGTAFQVTHNNGLLPVYDKWAFSVGPFLESGLVPLVLAPIWVSYAYAFPLLDQALAGAVQLPPGADAPKEAWQRVAQTWLLCAAQFILSDVLYLNGTPHAQIYVAMAVCTAAIWWLMDRSKTGLALGALLAVGAPLAEAVIVALPLWHYDRPDTPLGVCFWTAFCYASYGIGVGNWGRWQVHSQQRRRKQLE